MRVGALAAPKIKPLVLPKLVAPVTLPPPRKETLYAPALLVTAGSETAPVTETVLLKVVLLLMFNPPAVVSVLGKEVPAEEEITVREVLPAVSPRLTVPPKVELAVPELRVRLCAPDKEVENEIVAPPTKEEFKVASPVKVVAPVIVMVPKEAMLLPMLIPDVPV